MRNLNAKVGDAEDKTIKHLLDFEKEGERRRGQHHPAISVVPRMYRDQNTSCFDPRVISIGPLHRANKNVQENEGLKAAYLHDLLARRDSPPKQILEECLAKVHSSIDKIKVFYGGSTKYDDFELAIMMVTDACFIIEFLLKRKFGGINLGNRFILSNIMSDLVLLENQIPLFVLQDIFDSTVLMNYIPGFSLITLLLVHVLLTMAPFKPKLQYIDIQNSDRYYFKHILDLLLKIYQPPPTCSIPSTLSAIPIPHSALELDLVGVNFRPNLDDEKWPMAMKYESSGFFCFHRPTLRMPVITIHDKTELVLRNLIAYEQSAPINGYYFSSYASAMDMLVDSKEDVIKLVESKVIVKDLSSNESVANLINNIVDGLYYLEFSYESQWKDLDKYCNFYWPRNTAWLRRTYFNSPWNMIALVAVILLFVLSVIQTYFTVKPA